MRALAIIILISLFTASAYAEQLVIRTYHQSVYGIIKDIEAYCQGYLPDNSNYYLCKKETANIKNNCHAFCQSAGNINQYLNDGWRIISTRHIETSNDYYAGWCRCIGAEYILERQ